MEALGIETLCCNRYNRSIATIRVVIARSQLQRQRPVCCPLRLSIGDSSRIERALIQKCRSATKPWAHVPSSKLVHSGAVSFLLLRSDK